MSDQSRQAYDSTSVGDGSSSLSIWEDISGPYGEIPRGNNYKISSVFWLTNWSEAYAVKDKNARTVANLILTEIFPWYGAPLELVTDNGTENVNEIMKETINSLNIKHVTTSLYNPQSNAKVERFHRSLADILAKLADGENENWDIFNPSISCGEVFYKRDNKILAVFRYLGVLFWRWTTCWDLLGNMWVKITITLSSNNSTRSSFRLSGG